MSERGWTREGIGLGYRFAKRSMDISLSLVLVLLTSPVFALVALLVRLDSPGPVIYRRMVIGKHGRKFPMFKFRSMVVGAEQILAQDEELKSEYYRKCKIKDDPRVTRLGKILRKTSLDELPQLVNVFLGHMAFVGPRPIAEDEKPLYGPALDKVQTATPGLTGLWQISGRSETSYEQRVQLDTLYLEKRSFLFDLWIVMSTIPSVLLKKGAM